MRQLITKKQFQNSPALCNSIASLFMRRFDIADICDLHQEVHLDILRTGTDQSTIFHEVVYKEFDNGAISEVTRNYYNLLREWYLELAQEHSISDWAMQRYPSLRIHLPSNVSVFEFHRDSDYNHPLGEINHFLSVNQSISTASLHIERDLGWSNFIPLELKPFESAIINTSIFKHGDFINKEGYTRISIDFRAIPISILESLPTKYSLTKTKMFTINDYFVSSDELLGILK